MKKIIIFLALILLFSLTYSEEEIETGYSSLDALNDEISKIDGDIEQSKKKISAAKLQKRKLLVKLKEIEKELKIVKKEYRQIEDKFIGLSRNIDYGEKNLSIIRKELAEHDSDLRNKVALWYENGNKGAIEYVLSGDSLFDIKDREENLKIILANDKEIISRINQTKDNLENEKELIEEEKQEIASLRKELKKKKRKVDSKIREKNRVVKKLNRREKYYKTKITKLQAQKAQMEKEIQNIINNRSKKSYKAINFKTLVKEKGNMTYPLNGKVLVKYGDRKVGKVKSTAIEIKGRLGSRIKACSDGEVIFAGKFLNMGKVVMVDHGYDLVTIYGNLITTYIKIGDKVNKNQIIGVLGRSSTDKKPVLYFETRVRAEAMNPEIFLGKKR